MPSFTYKAVGVSGQDVVGELDAVDRRTALRELADRGACVTEIIEKKQLPGISLIGGSRSLRISSKQLAIMTRQLATSLHAGLTLLDSLDVMREELEHAPSGELLKRLGVRVQEGVSLSQAMSEQGKVFSPLYVRLVRVGETGGVLDTMLAQLADMLERQNDLRERVRTASIYPAILLLMGLGSVIIIVTVIMPSIIESLGVPVSMLPLPTRIMLAISDFIGARWVLLLVGSAAVAIAWRHYILRGFGRTWWDRTKLRVPILGRLISQMESARFARSLGILVKGGVTITDALSAARDTIQNSVMRSAMVELTASIQSGESISRPLQRCGLFRPLLVQMVRVGENTGRLDEMLLRAADVHEAETKVTLDRFVTVLPVLLILVLALVIGFIVAALVLAIVEFQTTGVAGFTT